MSIPRRTGQRRKGFLSPEAIEALAKAYSGRGVTSFGLYESTLHVWNPDARRAIRAAGWSYDPRTCGPNKEMKHTLPLIAGANVKNSARFRYLH